MARLKLFEDEQTKSVYDKYFPKPQVTGNGEQSDASHARQVVNLVVCTIKHQ